jgi:hypothetical protein
MNTVVRVGGEHIGAVLGEWERFPDELQSARCIWSEDANIFGRCFEERQDCGPGFLGAFQG